MKEESEPLKYYPDWNQTLGKTAKRGNKVHIHPHDLIIYIQRRDGLDKAGKIAVRLISRKFARLLDAIK